ncbi:IMP dehydrogenase [Streptomyces sp. NPDC055025]
MQAVSTPDLAIALARNGGLSFLHHNQPIQDQAAAVRTWKSISALRRSSSMSIFLAEQRHGPDCAP